MKDDFEKSTNTVFKEVIKEINEIQNTYPVETSTMFGTYIAQGAIYEYNKLLLNLGFIVGLSQDEMIELERIIKEKIANVPKIEKAKLNTAVEKIINRINKIHYEHLVGNSMFGPYNAQEAIDEYNKLLSSIVGYIADLSQDEIIELKRIIEEKIANVPKVEEEKLKAKQVYIDRKKQAFEKAKKRYAKRSIFYKLRSRIKGQDPKSLGEKKPEFLGHSRLDFMNIDKVNSLYDR